MAESGNGRKLSYTVLQVIAVWLVSALLAYGVVQTRLAVLEERVMRLLEDVSEIRADVKELIRRGQ